MALVNVAQKIQTAIDDLKIPHIQSKITNYITLSMGIASTIPDENITAYDLITAADKALYIAKSNGRNQYAQAWDL
ncbi:MAG: diguanylate cyclase domain-containing protein [Cuspidothrix sp.]